MRIARFTPDDIHPFLALAKDEGWISHRRELAFLLERSPNGCLVCHEDNQALGFVTAVRHERSGWIGNLLVRPGSRGRGIGSALFRQAMEVLALEGAVTVWLTASAAGRPLYERNGFRCCDTIRRWERDGAGRPKHPATTPLLPDWRAIDYLGWGDARDALLGYAAAGGSALGAEQGFLMLQPLGGCSQIGPFGALVGSTAEALLDQVVAASEERLLLDVPAANRAAPRMLTARRFTVMGEADLMYAGKPPAYHPECIYGLASMGSIG
ncbi:GNAT family N-acetyltransferase [Trichlorobacter ammonificans]|uniref:Ribosomal protein S18 acetylase RimI n=1 Tax=Trichlorobacter ammonificans TaxID=2916410 RepID=A0ABM9D606_9BACT|nr:GNAT family N-acetyltransferase [Trichlorobacter ammonificans]CAH2029868.1 Ribosomal protein S18 acetylase RimI [Trichlorobacter ammonificans]